MPKIFVSYRRKLSEDITARIRGRLISHYGEDSIFIDIHNIPAGVDFRQRIEQVLNESDIMIAVVGPKWLGSEKQGRTGIRRESDWVRLEVETALRRNVLVIPVLVQGAPMPLASDLPDSMKDFAYRTAVVVASGQDFDVHADRLIRSIDQMLSSRVSKPRPQPDTDSLAKPVAEGGGSEPQAAAKPQTSETHSERITGSKVTPAQILEPRATEAPNVEALGKEESLMAASGPNQRKYRERAAAVVAAVAVAGIISYSVISHFSSEPPKVAGAEAPAIVAAPIPVPIPPATPSTREASAETNPVITAIPQPLPNSSSPPIENKGSPVTVEEQPVPNCLAKIAQVRTNSNSVGGPFVPVTIRPNLSEASAVRTVAVSPTGKEIATSGDDGLIRLWDAYSFKLVRTLRGHVGPVYSIDYWIDGTLLVTAGFDGTVRLWNPLDGSGVQTFDTRLTGDSRGNPVKQFSVAFYPGTPLKYLASGGEDGIVRIWNIQSGALESTRVNNQAADGDRSTIRSLSFAPNGSGEFVTGGYDGKIRIYLATKHQVVTLDANSKKVLRTSYSPDNTRIVSAGSDGDVAVQNSATLKIWTVKTQSFKPFLGHRDYVVSAGWSPDGKRLVSGGGGRDKSVVLWDVESGQKLFAFSGHQSDVEAVAFFAGGSRIVSVGEDKTIKVWSVPDQKLILTAVGFGEKDHVVYIPDGCYSGSSGIENRVSILSDKSVRPMTSEDRRALFVPEGFSQLLAGR